MNVKTASAHQADTLFEQIRTLAQRLTLSERLRLIRDILTSVPVEDGAYSEPQKVRDQAQNEEEKAEIRRIRREKLKEEQLAWYARSDKDRDIYAGRLVALHAGDIVDSDTDKGALHSRIRRRFGSQPIAIIPAEETEMQTIMIRRSPLEDQLAKK